MSATGGGEDGKAHRAETVQHWSADNQLKLIPAPRGWTSHNAVQYLMKEFEVLARTSARGHLPRDYPPTGCPCRIYIRFTQSGTRTLPVGIRKRSFSTSFISCIEHHIAACRCEHCVEKTNLRTFVLAT
jgi:hypothetical protein